MKEEFNSTQALLKIDLKKDDLNESLQLSNFDPSSIEDLHLVITQMQKHLKAKAKALEQLEEANFYLESTVKRENEKLKVVN